MITEENIKTTHGITFQGSTTIICILKCNRKLTITHTQKDNFSDTGLLIRITNAQSFAHKIIPPNSLGLW